MALIQINADFGRLCDIMERIAVAMERAVGPVEITEEEPRKIRVTQPSDIGRVDTKGERAAMKRLHDLEAQLGG